MKLINKAGGIGNLEKQLLVHKNGSVTYQDPNTQEISTTASPISASIYNKILTRNQVRKEYQPIRSRQNFASATENVAVASTGAPSSISPRSSTVTYTAFSINSRRGPQNEGIAQLDEFAGLLKEKPKYTVLSRNKVQSSGSVEETTDEIEEDFIPETTTLRRGLFHNQYVSLQRKPIASQTTEEIPADIDTTLRPFTAESPRGFTPPR